MNKYKIVSKGRSGIAYIEKTRRMNIDSECLTGSSKFVRIWKDTIKYWITPTSKIPATNAEIFGIINSLEMKIGADKIEWDISPRSDWDGADLS